MGTVSSFFFPNRLLLADMGWIRALRLDLRRKYLMRFILVRSLIFLGAVFALALPSPCGAQATKPAPAAESQKKTVETAAQNYFTDVLLTNQNGEKRRLYSDLLKGKVIVINTFFS